MPPPIRIFISYARKDLEHLQALETHLANLKRQNLIEVWTDQKLQASTEWSPELLAQLRNAQLVLVLISPDMMASDFIHDIELTETFKRHERGEVRVVPVLVRPTDLKGHTLDRFQGLPRNFKPVTEWPNRDAAWVDVVTELRGLVDDVAKGAPNPPPSLPHPFIPPAWKGWARKEYDAPPPLTASQAPVSFRVERIYVELHSAWLSPAELEAYPVSTHAHPPPTRDCAPDEPDALDALDALDAELEDASDFRRPLTELVALPDVQRLALRGGPGSGKSTFLRRLLLQRLNDPGPEPVLPLYLELQTLGVWLKERPKGGASPEQLIAWAWRSPRTGAGSRRVSSGWGPMTSGGRRSPSTK